MLFCQSLSFLGARTKRTYKWIAKTVFPKQTNFKIVKPEALEAAVILINKRPRKSLDYKTPWEVFYLDKLDTDALQI